MKPLFFVHIPKTAGTSFRLAAIDYFGNRKVVRDYGDEVEETSKVVKRTVYKTGDYWTLYQAMEKAKSRMLCGHVHGVKYAAGMGVANIVTFLRDPVQRLVSEYRHAVRHRDYKQSFEVFYSRSHRINQQSKMLDRIPVQAIGFIGLTERYAESLEMINARYKLGLKFIERNTHRKSMDEAYSIDESECQHILTLHRKDDELYKWASKLFEQRLAVFRQGLPYAHCRLIDVSVKRAVGWAWWEDNVSDPVEVQVRVNGEVVAETTAHSFRSTLSSLLPPRKGYTSFTVPLSAKPGDAVDCVVKKTGQCFPHRPKVIS